MSATAASRSIPSLFSICAAARSISVSVSTGKVRWPGSAAYPPCKYRTATNSAGSPAFLASAESRDRIFCAAAPASPLYAGAAGDVFRLPALSAPISRSIPSPEFAQTGTTGMPSPSSSAGKSIFIPCFRTSSIMLTAATTGISSSSSCAVRYRPRSSAVPSRMFSTTSGCSCRR